MARIAGNSTASAPPRLWPDRELGSRVRRQELLECVADGIVGERPLRARLDRRRPSRVLQPERLHEAAVGPAHLRDLVPREVHVRGPVIRVERPRATERHHHQVGVRRLVGEHERLGRRSSLLESFFFGKIAFLEFIPAVEELHKFHLPMVLDDGLDDQLVLVGKFRGHDAQRSVVVAIPWLDLLVQFDSRVQEPDERSVVGRFSVWNSYFAFHGVPDKVTHPAAVVRHEVHPVLDGLPEQGHGLLHPHQQHLRDDGDEDDPPMQPSVFGRAGRAVDGVVRGDVAGAQKVEEAADAALARPQHHEVAEEFMPAVHCRS